MDVSRAEEIHGVDEASGAGVNLEKLLRIAREGLAVLEIDLADIGAALQNTKTSLDAVDEEWQATSCNPADCPNRDDLRARAANLRSTLMSLERAEEAVRERFALAQAEILKLTDLMKTHHPDQSDASSAPEGKTNQQI
ncbi:MAG: hypothetical protein DHS20C05_18090 [Hyphococcus sp.]|nr:MAG: hypothetical protein DHS20C05_18090 [Marinicaulis sp.]